MKILIACLLISLGAAAPTSAFDTASVDAPPASAMGSMRRAGSYGGPELLFDEGAKAY